MTATRSWPQPHALPTPRQGHHAARLLAVAPNALPAPWATSASPGRHLLSLRAGMAELVLLNRLQARTRHELTQDMLERAARIIEVTANSWLGYD